MRAAARGHAVYPAGACIFTTDAAGGGPKKKGSGTVNRGLALIRPGVPAPLWTSQRQEIDSVCMQRWHGTQRALRKAPGVGNKGNCAGARCSCNTGALRAAVVVGKTGARGVLGATTRRTWGVEAGRTMTAVLSGRPAIGWARIRWGGPSGWAALPATTHWPHGPARPTPACRRTAKGQGRVGPIEAEKTHRRGSSGTNGAACAACRPWQACGGECGTETAAWRTSLATSKPVWKVDPGLVRGVRRSFHANVIYGRSPFSRQKLPPNSDTAVRSVLQT